MRVVIATLLLFVVVAQPTAAQSPSLPFDALVRSLTDRIALPAYAGMETAMAALASETTAFCETPTRAAHERLIGAFHGAMDAWQRAQPTSFGPTTAQNRAERIEFWPDSGGVAARQLRRALVQRDAKLVAENGLAGHSVALQNLSTFERLLMENLPRLADGKGGEEDEYACALAAAVGRFQAGLAKIIHEEWAGPFRDSLTSAEHGNARYPEPRIAASEYLRGIASALDLAISAKLERPMGPDLAAARPDRAESYRTQRSLENVIRNLETARDLFSAPDGFGDVLAKAGAAPLASGMRDWFALAVQHAEAVGMPLETAVVTPQGREKLLELLDDLKGLRTLMMEQLAKTIGIAIGFNAADGD